MCGVGRHDGERLAGEEGINDSKLAGGVLAFSEGA